MEHTIVKVWQATTVAKNKTLACLESIRKGLETLGKEYCVSIFVCDDGSTDGTREALANYSGLSISIIDGDGNLFWAKGMAKALAVAEKVNPDFYLLVNDDVVFFPNMLSIMLESYSERRDRMCAIVGCTLNNEKTCCSYGGFCWDNKSILLKKNYRRVLPTDSKRDCKWANWNCFLLTKELYYAVGKIDDFYEHSFADYDYSNRIIRKGFHMVVANQYIGTCNRNPIAGTYLDKTLPFKKRCSLIHKRTARPYRSSWHYAKKFYGIFAPLYFLQPYFYVTVTSSCLFKSLKNSDFSSHFIITLIICPFLFS